MCCLFLNKGIDEFKITDDELEQAQQLEFSCPELWTISRIIGELFEEYEMSLDSIDQMMALFLALNSEKIELIKN